MSFLRVDLENQYNLSTNLILKSTLLKSVFCQTIALINKDGGMLTFVFTI
jgi:hypothetical protein